MPGKKVKKCGILSNASNVFYIALVRSAFSEDDIIQTISDVCDRKRKAGEWMWTVDLTEKLSSVKGSLYWNEPSEAEITAQETEGARFLFVERRNQVRKSSPCVHDAS